MTAQSFKEYHEFSWPFRYDGFTNLMKLAQKGLSCFFWRHLRVYDTMIEFHHGRNR